MRASHCSHFQELASTLADDSLEAAGIVELYDHLDICSECRQFLNDIYRIRDCLRAEEARSNVQPSSPGFAAAVTRHLERERLFARPEADSGRGRRAVFFRRNLSGAVAAAVLLLAAGWVLFRVSSPEEAARMESSSVADNVTNEGSMASYFRQYTLQTMDATFLGPPEGIELASFEMLEKSVE